MAEDGGWTSSVPSPVAQVTANVDLFTEILSRLSTKCVVRFKCVSKDWLSHISDSDFALNYVHRNPEKPLVFGFYLSTPSGVKYVSLRRRPIPPALSFLDSITAGSTIRISDSCNGLILLSLFSDRNPGARYIVCNPTAQKYTLIPEFDEISIHYGACLAFDPSKSPHYKIVKFVMDRFSHESPTSRTYVSMDVYSSWCGTWKHVAVIDRSDISVQGLFCNGAIHWCSQEGLHIKLDTEVEKLTRTPLPEFLSSHEFGYFRGCGDHLLFIHHIYGTDDVGFKIYEMDSDYNSWELRYDVDLKFIVTEFSNVDREIGSCTFSVLGVLKERNEKHDKFMLAIGGKVIWYNGKGKSWKVLCDDFQPGTDYDKICKQPYYHEFIESLSPVFLG